MTWLREDRRARRQRVCDSGRGGDCLWTIKPGQMYQFTSLPPNGDLGNEQWLHLHLCTVCAAFYGYPVGEGK